MKKLIAVAGLLMGLQGMAEAIGGPGSIQRGYRSISEVTAGVPTILDDMRTREMVETFDDRRLAKFSEPWETAGCEVEGMGAQDRIICPGWRIDPKVKPEAPVQFAAKEFPALKVKKLKGDLEGKI